MAIVYLYLLCAFLIEGEKVKIRETTKKEKLGQRKINKVNHTFIRIGEIMILKTHLQNNMVLLL